MPMSKSTAKIIDGRAIAGRLKQALQAELAGFGKPPELRVLYFNQPASQVYWHAQQTLAKELGIGTGSGGASGEWRNGSTMQPWDISQDHLNAIIDWWNKDPRVHGIFVHQPMPPQIDAQLVSSLIDPRKDIEGIHPQNSARRFFAKSRIGSCTALSVMELIESTGITLEGKEAVVVGHSEIVGRPVSMLLLDKLATTTICHVGTDKAGRLEEHVRRADVLVVAVGRPQFIKGAWIKPGAVVIDVGINVVSGKVVGDIEASAAEQAAWVSPVPGGVGPVTAMMVMKNTIEAYKMQAVQSGHPA